MTLISRVTKYLKFINIVFEDKREIFAETCL
jgi:hypothetical protein